MHWFAVIRISEDFVEIFDPLGVDIAFLREWFSLRYIYEYNSTAVQCLDSRLCGPFVVFFVILRYMNLDLEFVDFLNYYFSLDCNENERIVRDFLQNME